jgi:hypothetical protein
MIMVSLADRHAAKLCGVLSCFDRVVLKGMLPDIGYARAMGRELTRRGIRIFDYTHFAEPLREEIRENAERVAAEAGLEIEYIRKKTFRKDDRIKAILRERGEHPGLVHIFSAMEPCPSFRPWHDKGSGKTFLKPRDGKCLHYYFYYVDRWLGLCYLRVPTWAPFGLQFGFNGHHVLAQQLTQRRIAFTKVENAFLWIEDLPKAQHLADSFSAKRLHRRVDEIARRCCPVVAQFTAGYHWSLWQVEYATDLMFRDASALQALYDGLVRAAVQAVKVEQVATFLGHKLDGRYQGEVGTDLQRRVQGTRIRHHMGPAALKMYDKLLQILRVETTTIDVTFFRHPRTVEHRDGSSEFKVAPLKKSIYSLAALRRLMHASNRRYLEFLTTLEDSSTGARHLQRISAPVRRDGRSYRGFNLFAEDDLALFRVIARGEFNIHGFRNRDLRHVLPHFDGRQISRMLKRLRVHGLIKKVRGGYRYHLTRLGRQGVAAALKVRELVIIPTLTQPVTI